MTRQTILLTDLNCPSCAQDLESTVKKLPGVEKAEVMFGAGTLDIAYDEKQLDAKKLEKTIKSFGIGVASTIGG